MKILEDHFKRIKIKDQIKNFNADSLSIIQ